MKLTRLAVLHPVIAVTVTAAVVIFGIASFLTLGLEQNPQVNVPIVTITVPYPGASAESVEESVTRPVEDAVAGLGGIKTITSNSQTSAATITVEFEDGTDVDVAASDVQQRISGIRGTLPPDVEDPSYAKLDFNDIAILNLAVTAEGNPDPLQLYRVANDTVRPSLETAGGVGRVVVVGGQVPEVHVDILPDRLQAYGLTISDVTSAVQSQFVSTTGGRFTNAAGAQQAPVRINTRGTDLTALANVPVTAAANGTAASPSITLANVATIALAGEEPEQLLRVNGRSAVGLLVYKQSSANITQTVDSLRPRIDALQAQLPSGYRLETIVDQSTSVRQTVRGVEEELVLAGIITGIVLFLFLHSLRSTVIVLVAIPISLLIALIAMKLTGLTLNNISLIGLTTSIGVLVDDSIVVLENIHSHLERDEDPQTAAIEGRSEIGMAAIAITLVDVAVWGPIIVLSGIVGAFLRSFAIVIVGAVLASLLVSFTLTPLMASRWLAVTEGRSLAMRIAMVWEPLYQRLARGYHRLLGWSLRHRPVVMILTALVFAANFLILPLIGTEFVPEANTTTASVVGELPPGTALDASSRAAQRWEAVIMDRTYFPEVQTVYTQVGRAEASTDPRLITVTLALSDPKSRVRTSQEIARVVADTGVLLVPELRTRVAGAGVAGAAQPLQLRVFSNDLDQLAQLAAQAQTQLAAQPELADVTNSLAVGPEATVTPITARLQDLGLTAQAVGSLVHIALQGVVVGQWTEPSGQDRDVRVELPPDVRNNQDAIGSLPLVQRQGIPISLRQVATVTTENKPTTITRVNRQRTATLGAQPNGVPLGTATTAATRTLNAMSLPAGARWELAGTAQTQQESFAQLALGLGASVLLMFMILSILYENWLQPLLIQTALPLATVGAFLGLLVFRQTLSLPTFIGLIALFGLVGKNSILLVDRANHLREQGLDRTVALEQAGETRFRPILMTSAVLIFSMLPVALKLGEGGEGRAPLGAVLVGGMLTNTLLSLVYVPVAYTYFDSFGVWLTRLIRREHGRRRWRGSLRRVVDGRPTGAGRSDTPGRDTPPVRPSSGAPLDADNAPTAPDQDRTGREAAGAEPTGASRRRRG